MKIRAVVFEFFVSRQTDRRGGGLCFIICKDRCYTELLLQTLGSDSSVENKKKKTRTDVR